ncbi:MAG: hypothetical protein ACXAC5_03510 [Promethearchaeota archaeon]|jgi:hypothetical protein
MDEDLIRGFDEAGTALVRTMPGFLWSFYSALMKEGFTPEQALELTKCYLDKMK